jgi:hypothetical protein
VLEASDKDKKSKCGDDISFDVEPEQLPQYTQRELFAKWKGINHYVTDISGWPTFYTANAIFTFTVVEYTRARRTTIAQNYYSLAGIVSSAANFNSTANNRIGDVGALPSLYVFTLLSAQRPPSSRILRP